MTIVYFNEYHHKLPKPLADEWTAWFDRHGLKPYLIAFDSKLIIDGDQVTVTEWYRRDGEQWPAWQDKTYTLTQPIGKLPAGYPIEEN